MSSSKSMEHQGGLTTGSETMSSDSISTHSYRLKNPSTSNTGAPLKVVDSLRNTVANEGDATGFPLARRSSGFPKREEPPNSSERSDEGPTSEEKEQVPQMESDHQRPLRISARGLDAKERSHLKPLTADRSSRLPKFEPELDMEDLPVSSLASESTTPEGHTQNHGPHNFLSRFQKEAAQSVTDSLPMRRGPISILSARDSSGAADRKTGSSLSSETTDREPDAKSVAAFKHTEAQANMPLGLELIAPALGGRKVDPTQARFDELWKQKLAFSDRSGPKHHPNKRDPLCELKRAKTDPGDERTLTQTAQRKVSDRRGIQPTEIYVSREQPAGNSVLAEGTRVSAKVFRLELGGDGSVSKMNETLKRDSPAPDARSSRSEITNGAAPPTAVSEAAGTGARSKASPAPAAETDAAPVGVSENLLKSPSAEKTGVESALRSEIREASASVAEVDASRAASFTASSNSIAAVAREKGALLLRSLKVPVVKVTATTNTGTPSEAIKAQGRSWRVEDAIPLEIGGRQFETSRADLNFAANTRRPNLTGNSRTAPSTEIGAGAGSSAGSRVVLRATSRTEAGESTPLKLSRIPTLLPRMLNRFGKASMVSKGFTESSVIIEAIGNVTTKDSLSEVTVRSERQSVHFKREVPLSKRGGKEVSEEDLVACDRELKKQNQSNSRTEEPADAPGDEFRDSVDALQAPAPAKSPSPKPKVRISVSRIPRLLKLRAPEPNGRETEERPRIGNPPRSVAVAVASALPEIRQRWLTAGSGHVVNRDSTKVLASVKLSQKVAELPASRLRLRNVQPSTRTNRPEPKQVIPLGNVALKVKALEERKAPRILQSMRLFGASGNPDSAKRMECPRNSAATKEAGVPEEGPLSSKNLAGPTENPQQKSGVRTMISESRKSFGPKKQDPVAGHGSLTISQLSLSELLSSLSEEPRKQPKSDAVLVGPAWIPVANSSTKSRDSRESGKGLKEQRGGSKVFVKSDRCAVESPKRIAEEEGVNDLENEMVDIAAEVDRAEIRRAACDELRQQERNRRRTERGHTSHRSARRETDRCRAHKNEREGRSGRKIRGMEHGVGGAGKHGSRSRKKRDGATSRSKGVLLSEERTSESPGNGGFHVERGPEEEHRVFQGRAMKKKNFRVVNAAQLGSLVMMWKGSSDKKCPMLPAFRSQLGRTNEPIHG